MHVTHEAGGPVTDLVGGPVAACLPGWPAVRRHGVEEWLTSP